MAGKGVTLMEKLQSSCPVLSIRGLSVSFFQHPVIRDVSLDVPKGGIAVLVGRSGSGKTTLLRAVNRLNEEVSGCRTTGQVEIFLESGPAFVYPGEEGGALPLTELRRRVGMVFQTPQVFPVSVYRNIAMPLSVAQGCPRSELEGRVEQALRQADLWKEVSDRLDMPADRLSGGQQQRLCLARALALEPDMLLLDEPTASLAVRAARHVEELLAALSERLPVVMVSHGLAQSLRLASFLAVMECGTLVRTLESVDGLEEKDLERLLEEGERGTGEEI